MFQKFLSFSAWVMFFPFLCPPRSMAQNLEVPSRLFFDESVCARLSPFQFASEHFHSSHKTSAGDFEGKISLDGVSVSLREKNGEPGVYLTQDARLIRVCILEPSNDLPRVYVEQSIALPERVVFELKELRLRSYKLGAQKLFAFETIPLFPSNAFFRASDGGSAIETLSSGQIVLNVAKAGMLSHDGKVVPKFGDFFKSLELHMLPLLDE